MEEDVANELMEELDSDGDGVVFARRCRALPLCRVVWVGRTGARRAAGTHLLISKA
jgi:hypothetical protein